MSHELIRLTSRLCNTPQLVSEEYLNKVMEILEARNSSSPLELAVTNQLADREHRLNYYPDKKLGVVEMDGGITAVPYYGMCGARGVSHQAIREQVKQLIEAGAETIILDQSSPGGEAMHTFESAEYIRNLADENGVKLVAYVSQFSYSASYAYTAVAHEAIINPSAEAGSIGVRVKLRNVNGALKNMGIEDVYITAGEDKVPFAADGSFTESFLSDIKESVLEMYDQFTGHVAMWRGLEKDKVVALGAKTYSSKKALANGLVDKIMTEAEFAKEYLNSDEEPMAIKDLLKPKQKDKQMSVETEDFQATLSAKLEELKTEMEAGFNTKLAEFQQAALAKEEELAQLKAALASKEEAEKELKASNRLKTLSNVVGDVQAPTLLASLSSLDDVQFEAVVGAMKVADAQADEGDVELGEGGKAVVTEDADPIATAQANLAARRKQKFAKKEGK